MPAAAAACRVPGARDEIHAHVLDRFFEELVGEPSNVLFTARTGPDSIRYDAMDCFLDRMPGPHGTDPLPRLNDAAFLQLR